MLEILLWVFKSHFDVGINECWVNELCNLLSKSDVTGGFYAKKPLFSTSLFLSWWVNGCLCSEVEESWTGVLSLLSNFYIIISCTTAAAIQKLKTIDFINFCKKKSQHIFAIVLKRLHSVHCVAAMQSMLIIWCIGYDLTQFWQCTHTPVLVRDGKRVYTHWRWCTSACL